MERMSGINNDFAKNIINFEVIENWRLKIF